MTSPIEKIALADRDAKRIIALTDWYVEGIRKIWQHIPKRNSAFMYAGKRGTNELNAELDDRFRIAFIDVRDQERLAAIRKVLADKIREVIDRIVAIDEDSTSATLDNYLIAMTSILEGTRQGAALRSLNGKPLEEGVQQASALWAAMRNAKIFDFTFDTYAQIHRAADVYTAEKIAGVPWNPPTADAAANAKLYMESVEEAGTQVPFPDPLPFDHCYIGLGQGSVLSQDQLSARVGRGFEDRMMTVVSSAILGYMIWNGSGGQVVEIVQVVERDDNYIVPNTVCIGGIWDSPVWNLAPWIVTHLVAIINEHRQIVLEPTKPSFAQKREYEKIRKKYKAPGILPRPYYVVRMEKTLIDAAGERTRHELARIARELKYRHDRRGHERCYIRRGNLPLESKDAADLAEAGYKVWTLDAPDSNAYRQLMERGQPPKRAGEWIAILTKWVAPTVVGKDKPELPYIPAIRQPSRQAS